MKDNLENLVGKKAINIVLAKSFEEVNNHKFAALLKSGFGKPLVEDYFSMTKPSHIWLAKYKGYYAGAAVVEPVPNLEGVGYLDKFVVSSPYKGKSVGKKLWGNFSDGFGKAIWRAKKGNPIINFYETKADGIITLGDVPSFAFFYFGLNSKELPVALSYAVNKKPSFIEPDPIFQQMKGGKL